MKFSFISAGPNKGFDARERNKSVAAFPPLSLLYLAAVLEKVDVEVSILDQPGKGLTIEETVEWVEKESPDVLGFSTLASSGRMAAAISSKIKEKNPEILTIFGNHYATFNAERILKKYPSVDVVARGEGENIVDELAESLQKDRDLAKVRGITYRSKETGKIVTNSDQPLIKDLNKLPFPNRRLLDVEYHCMIAGANAAPKKFTSVVSSRGCVYGCRFCSCTEFAHKLWRARTAENTLEELRLLQTEGYRQVLFVDDNFTVNPKRVIEICRGMRKEKIDIEWICEGRVDNCSYEMLREMVRAGLKILYFGIESANQRILDYYNKKATPQQAENAVRTARKAGVDVVVGSFIVGAPDETREEIQNTINFAKRIPIDLPQFNILGAHPGNEVWNEFVANGLLDEEKYWETGIAVSKIAKTAVPLNEIRQMVYNAFFQHVSRPTFLAEQIAKTLKSKYRMHVILSNMSRIKEISDSAHAIA